MKARSAHFAASVKNRTLFGPLIVASIALSEQPCDVRRVHAWQRGDSRQAGTPGYVLLRLSKVRAKHCRLTAVADPFHPPSDAAPHWQDSRGWQLLLSWRPSRGGGHAALSQRQGRSSPPLRRGAAHSPPPVSLDCAWQAAAPCSAAVPNVWPAGAGAHVEWAHSGRAGGQQRRPGRPLGL